MSAFSKLYVLNSLYTLNGDWGILERKAREKGYKLEKRMWLTSLTFTTTVA